MRFATAMLLLAGLAGCSGGSPARTVESGPAITLTASLTSPTEIVLGWRVDGPPAAGYVVEFATEPGGPFTILRFLPEPARTYRHRDLLPSTRFIYRVRPFYGPASEPARIATDTPGPASTDHSTCSIREGHAEACAPADLTVTAADGDTVRFGWSDRTSDEQGFLLEARTGRAGFDPVAVFEPGVAEASLVILPGERDADFRVRAFYYGTPSNPAQRTTGGSVP